MTDKYNVLPKMKIVVNPGENILLECLFTPGGFTQPDKGDIPSIATNFRSTKRTAHNAIYGHCWLVKNNIDLIRKKLQDDDLLQAMKSVFYPDGYKEYPIAKKINTIASYEKFIHQHPDSGFVKNAKQNIATINKNKEDQIHALWIKLASEQKCTVKHDKWVYIDAACKNNYADGLGRAVYEDRQHSFKGTISHGVFVTGKYLKDGKLQFDGTFKDGEPNGTGICIYNNEPEECKYYQGKRVDSLYKQRQQIAAMEQRQKHEMEKLRGEIKNINNRKTHVKSAQGSSSVGDKLLDSAIDKGMEKLFDHLF